MDNTQQHSRDFLNSVPAAFADPVFVKDRKNSGRTGITPADIAHDATLDD